jgi:hypothetical protein
LHFGNKYDKIKKQKKGEIEMAVTIEKIAKDLGVQVEKLLTESILAYLEKKKIGTMRSKLELTSKYNVTFAKELEEKIKRGEVEEHPAWEDLITLENLEQSLKEIESELADLRSAGKISSS